MGVEDLIIGKSQEGLRPESVSLRAQKCRTSPDLVDRSFSHRQCGVRMGGLLDLIGNGGAGW